MVNDDDTENRIRATGLIVPFYSGQAVNQDDFSDRLRAVLGGRSQTAFAGLVGMSVSGLGKYLNGLSDPTREVLIRLADAAGVSVEWLATGNGPKTPVSLPVTPSGYENPEDRSGGRESMIRETGAAYPKSVQTEFVPVPRLAVKASAGSGAMVYEEEQLGALAFRRDFLRALGARQEDLFAIEVDGDSMSPTLLPGEVILVDVAAAKRPVRDGIWLIRIGDALLVKRLQVTAKGRVNIRSDNPMYEPYERTIADETGEFQILGKVTWGGRRY